MKSQSPITVISGGGDDISLACKLPTKTPRVLDWFHIGMRFEQRSGALSGLRALDPDEGAAAISRTTSAKWYVRAQSLGALLQAT